jgi:hypothetical protein
MQPFLGHYLFPCFDSPDIKSVINLILIIPKNMQAFSCTEYFEIDDSYDNKEKFNLDFYLDINNPYCNLHLINEIN